jgi:hypothetical protein
LHLTQGIIALLFANFTAGQAGVDGFDLILKFDKYIMSKLFWREP